MMAAPPMNVTHGNTKDSNILDNTNKIGNSTNNYTQDTPLPLFQRYEFPVLAEDPSSISKARTDPLACNVNNDAVLIWNDVIINRRDCDALPGNITSLPEVSIEDVYQKLQTTVEAYTGVSSRISNEDDPDGFDNENLKEHLHDYHRRSHRQNHHDHRHLKHEDAVVSRRRMFEQGLDLPFISKSTCNIEKCNEDFINSSASACNKLECGKNVDFLEHENSSREACDGETKLGKSGSEDCNLDVVDFSNDFNISEAILFKSRREDIDISNENSFLVFPVENDDSNGIKKSYLDSGHFEDFSAELLSPYRSSTGSDVFLSSNEDHDNKNVEKSPGVINVEEEQEEEDEQYISQTDLNLDSPARAGHDTFLDDSEVFLEDGKEIDTTMDDSNLLRSHYEPRPYRVNVKNHHKTRSKGRKKHKTSDKEKTWRDDASIIVRCANASCKNVSNLVEARKGYKNCHHCLRTYYCCRGCRREDWARHKNHGYCHGSRVSTACKKIIRHCNTNPEIKSVLSRLAVRGYLSHGRGCVMLGFPDLESTDEFMEFGFPMLELNPIYVSAKELSVSKMYGNVLEKLLETCRSYKPDVKFVLNVGVGLRFTKEDFLSFSWLHQGNQYCYRNQNHEEVDTFGSLGSDLGYGSLSSNLNTSGKSISFSHDSPKNNCSHCFVFDNYSQRSPSSRHKAPILQKFIKLKLSPLHAHQEHERRLTFEKHFWDEFRTAGPTLILTSIPERSGADINQSGDRKRELTFINIQRKLRERNVDLRHQYPLVHAHLIAYVTRGVHFPSQVLFPVDSKTGKTFTCFMMPEAEAEIEWMQSHYLLNDLELSRESLNRSRSKSLSSSMPSLHSSPKMDNHSTHDASGVTPKEDNLDKKINRKSRSVSFSQLNNVDYYLELSPTPDTSIPKSIMNKEASGKKIPPEKNVNQMDLEADDDSDITECLSVEIPGNKMLSKGETGTSSPIDIQMERSIPELVVTKAPDSHNQRLQEELVCKNKQEEFHWATNHKVTPSFYPVRKARNVKLNSHKQSNSASSESHEKQRRKPWQLSVEITPLSLTPSSPTALLSSPTTLSPALYTSTPKSSKPPVFEDILTSTFRPSLNNLSHEKHDTSCDQYATNNSSIPVYNNCSYCENCINTTHNANTNNDLAYSKMDHVSKNRIQNSEREYGFDSCYRNKVIVDEVDQMKRRRKDRNSKHPAHHNLEYYRFENDALQSPPLATSTLERSRRDGRERNVYCGSKYSKRRAKHKKCENFRFDGSVNAIVDDRGASNDCRSAFDSCPVFTDSNEDSRHGRQNEVTHVTSDDNAEGTEKESSADHNADLSCHNDLVDLNARFSPNFRRKCNTNYFPRNFRINKLSPTSISHIEDCHDCDNDSRINEGCLRNGTHNKYCLKDNISHAKTNSYSKNSKRSPPSTNQFTSNNKNDDNIMTNSFQQSSPPTSDNTPKASTPKTSLRNHSNKNAIISSSKHQDRHCSHPPVPQPHLRMRIFEDVTHHLANQTSGCQCITADPNSNSSRRKIKFDLPNSDSASKRQEIDVQQRSRHPSVRNDKHSKNSVSFSTEFSHRNLPDENDLHHSTCRLVPAINMSYSSDW